MIKGKKIVATIECRMASTRLPGKVLMPLAQKPVLEVLVNRLRKVKEIDQIVLATTENKTDDLIIDLAKRIDCAYFRGSEEDVLARVLGALKQFKADIVVETTGDCPFLDPQIVAQTIGLYFANLCDYASNNLLRTYPIGMDTQVFSRALLEKADKDGLTKPDREHVSWYFIRNPQIFKLLVLPSTPELFWPDLRLTLDEQSDYLVLNNIAEHFSAKDNDSPSCLEILQYLKKHPQIVKINSHVKQRKQTD